ncbi:MAG: galactose-1-phosphate uridylyltransferase [Candidatus Melainabacteria bacterium]|nr:galactose-1-phosphate uridylyltransferase [Candidatus Melainabacteria bacterium]
MSEMRWHPLLGEWVITATHRQDRTFLPPAGYCPLCPTAEGGFPTEVPRPDYDFVVFENKFPSLKREPGDPAIAGTALCPVKPSSGACEVILYSPKHDATLSDLPPKKLVELIRVWRDRYNTLAAREDIKYVFIFENKGEAVGVTIHHPHGQIYAFSELPPMIERELKSEREHMEKSGKCIHCEIIAEEKSSNARLVAENANFIAFVPFYARYPYELHLYSKHHRAAINEFSKQEDLDLAEILHVVLKKFDGLWNISLPYMMVMHQRPTDDQDYPGSHFHIEFYPPLRTPQKRKYLAGVESGAGTYINDTHPEVTSQELRNVLPHLEQA